MAWPTTANCITDHCCDICFDHSWWVERSIFLVCCLLSALVSADFLLADTRSLRSPAHLREKHKDCFFALIHVNTLLISLCLSSRVLDLLPQPMSFPVFVLSQFLWESGTMLAFCTVVCMVVHYSMPLFSDPMVMQNEDPKHVCCVFAKSLAAMLGIRWLCLAAQFWTHRWWPKAVITSIFSLTLAILFMLLFLMLTRLASVIYNMIKANQLMSLPWHRRVAPSLVSFALLTLAVIGHPFAVYVFASETRDILHAEFYSTNEYDGYFPKAPYCVYPFQPLVFGVALACIFCMHGLTWRPTWPCATVVNKRLSATLLPGNACKRERVALPRLSTLRILPGQHTPNPSELTLPHTPRRVSAANSSLLPPDFMSSSVCGGQSGGGLSADVSPMASRRQSTCSNAEPLIANPSLAPAVALNKDRPSVPHESCAQGAGKTQFIITVSRSPSAGGGPVDTQDAGGGTPRIRPESASDGSDLTKLRDSPESDSGQRAGHAAPGM